MTNDINRIVTPNFQLIFRRKTYKFSGDYISVELQYQIAKMAHWSGDIRFICAAQNICNIENENVEYDSYMNLTNNALLKFFLVNITTKNKKLLYVANDKVNVPCISLSEIERDGIPRIGESIYKEYLYYPLF